VNLKLSKINIFQFNKLIFIIIKHIFVLQAREINFFGLCQKFAAFAETKNRISLQDAAIISIINAFSSGLWRTIHVHFVGHAQAMSKESRTL
jgi:hypothetical protein